MRFRVPVIAVCVLVLLLVPVASCGGGGGGGAPALPTLVLADGVGLRSSDSGVTVLLLTFMAVKTVTEDRTILHFATAGAPATFTSARLDIPISNIDAGPPDGTFDVYSFTGDGVVSIDEWANGSLAQPITGIGGGIQVLPIDVTTQLQSALAASRPYLSFNLRAGAGSDRYWLGSTGGLPDPTLTITP